MARPEISFHWFHSQFRIRIQSLINISTLQNRIITISTFLNRIIVKSNPQYYFCSTISIPLQSRTWFQLSCNLYGNSQLQILCRTRIISTHTHKCVFSGNRCLALANRRIIIINRRKLQKLLLYRTPPNIEYVCHSGKPFWCLNFDMKREPRRDVFALFDH